jgi:hypothetical protein
LSKRALGLRSEEREGEGWGFVIVSRSYMVGWCLFAIAKKMEVPVEELVVAGREHF